MFKILSLNDLVMEILGQNGLVVANDHISTTLKVIDKVIIKCFKQYFFGATRFDKTISYNFNAIINAMDDMSENNPRQKHIRSFNDSIHTPSICYN